MSINFFIKFFHSLCGNIACIPLNKTEKENILNINYSKYFNSQNILKMDREIFDYHNLDNINNSKLNLIKFVNDFDLLKKIENYEVLKNGN